MVDGCRSKLVNVISGVTQGNVLGPLLFFLYTSELFFILENKMIGYADDSTLMAVVKTPCVRVAVAEFLIRDLGNQQCGAQLPTHTLNLTGFSGVLVF